MYDLKINKDHNAMLIKIDGRMEMEEALAYNQKYRECIDQMQPGFAVIVDVTAFVPTEEDVRQKLKEANEYAIEKGMGRVVRIVTDTVTSKVGNIQLNRQARELGYTAEMVNSLEEALALLGID